MDTGGADCNVIINRNTTKLATGRSRASVLFLNNGAFLTDSSVLPQLGPTNIQFNVQPPIQTFNGRTKILSDLHRLVQDIWGHDHDGSASAGGHCESAPFITIAGSSGIGKTEVVRMYIAQHGAAYDHVIWIDAEERKAQFQLLAKELKIQTQIPAGPESPETETKSKKESDFIIVLRNVYEKLCSNLSRVLLVFDNAEHALGDNDHGNNGFLKYLPKALLSNSPSNVPPVVLITSQNKSWEFQNDSVIHLNLWSDDEYVSFILAQFNLENLPENETIAFELGHLLGGLPIALHLAVTVIRLEANQRQEEDEYRYGACAEIRNFIKDFNRCKCEMGNTQNIKNVCGAGAPAQTTMSIILSLITQKLSKIPRGDLALKILYFLAYLSPTLIPTDLIFALFENDPEIDRVEVALGLLVDYSLISNFSLYCTIHEMVQDAVIEELKAKTEEVADSGEVPETVMNETNVLMDLSQKLTVIIQTTCEIEKDHDILVNLIHLANHIFDKLSVDNFRVFIEHVADLLHKIGEFTRAVELYEKVVEATKGKEGHGHGHENTFEIKSKMAVALRESGKYDQAKQIFMEIFKAQVGAHCICPNSAEISKSGPPTNKSQDQDQRQKDCVGALDSCSQAAQAQENIIEDADLFRYNIELSETVQTFQRNERDDRACADFLRDEVAEAREKLRDSQNLVTSGHTETFSAPSQDTSAEIKSAGFNAHDDFLERRESLSTLDFKKIQNNDRSDLQDYYGDNYQSASDLSDDLAETEESLSSFDSTITNVSDDMISLLSDSDIGTASAFPALDEVSKWREDLNNLHSNVKENDDSIIAVHTVAQADKNSAMDAPRDQVQEVWEDSISIQSDYSIDIEATLQNPNKSDSKTTDATQLFARGNYDGALKLFSEILEDQEDILGSNHAETLRTEGNIAHVLTAQGEYRKAGEILVEVHERAASVLGSHHPYTFTFERNFANNLYHSGQYQKATKIYTKMLDAMKEAPLHPHHPTVLATMNGLATVHTRLGDLDEALRILEEIIKICGQEFGEDHPHTLIYRNNLGFVLQEDGMFDEAYEMLREVLEKQEVVLGVMHPDTLTTEHNVALLYFNEGDYPNAVRIAGDVLNLRERVLGRKHPAFRDSLNLFNDSQAMLLAEM